MTSKVIVDSSCLTMSPKWCTGDDQGALIVIQSNYRNCLKELIPTKLVLGSVHHMSNDDIIYVCLPPMSTIYVHVGRVSVLTEMEGLPGIISFVWKTIFWSGESQGSLCLLS